MAKKKRLKRRRSFKVHSDFNGLPFVRFGGKYLINELGLTCGDRLELIHDKDMIVLRKFSATELTQYEQLQRQKQAKSLLAKLFPSVSLESLSPAMMVAEAPANSYTVEEEILQHPDKYSRV